jgi:hypothetical protein
MKNIVLRNGIIAGLIVGIPMLAYFLSVPADGTLSPHMMVLTYIVMLVALSMVFVGIKQYRDQVLGGVIKFGRCSWGWGSAPSRDCSMQSRGKSARHS